MALTHSLVYRAHIPLLTNNTLWSGLKRLLFCYFGRVFVSIIAILRLTCNKRKLKLIHNNFKYRHTTSVNTCFKNTVFRDARAVQIGKYIPSCQRSFLLQTSAWCGTMCHCTRRHTPENMTFHQYTIFSLANIQGGGSKVTGHSTIQLVVPSVN